MIADRDRDRDDQRLSLERIGILRRPEVDVKRGAIFARGTTLRARHEEPSRLTLKGRASTARLTLFHHEEGALQGNRACNFVVFFVNSLLLLLLVLFLVSNRIVPRETSLTCVHTELKGEANAT